MKEMRIIVISMVLIDVKNRKNKEKNNKKMICLSVSAVRVVSSQETCSTSSLVQVVLGHDS